MTKPWMVVVAFLAGVMSCYCWQDRGRDALVQALKNEREAKVRYRTEVESAAVEASRSEQDADSLRKLAVLLAPRGGARTRQSTGRSLPNVPGTSPSTAEPTTDLGATATDYDSLAQAYVLMVRVDSLNQVTIGALTRRIVADSQYIASLEAVRDAAEDVVPEGKLFGLLPRPRLGVTLGYVVTKDGRQGPGVGVGITFTF